MLYRHAQSIFGDAPEPDALPETEFVDLGYSLAHAFFLWSAWDKHGKTPKAGGLEDQPRAWQRMIQTMNRYFNTAYELAKEDHVPSQGAGGSDRTDQSEDWEGMFSDLADQPRKNLGDLMNW